MWLDSGLDQCLTYRNQSGWVHGDKNPLSIILPQFCLKVPNFGLGHEKDTKILCIIRAFAK